MAMIQLEPALQKELIVRIKQYYLLARDEDLSDFAAENLLRFMLESIGPAIYNQAIEDAYVLIRDKAEDLFGLQKR
ncbi:MAG: DUF2164 domain-containing protein [Sporomusaceae bacterium]|nr:DUF2164 domain-containing protein [Sporomusaceae bacterium]